MCRFGYYEGPSLALADLLYTPEHSIEEQSVAPREMLAGRINVDGVGVAWWPTRAEEPMRYRTMGTTWGDPNLPELAPRLRGERLIVHVRSATPGIPVGPSQVAPFMAEGITFTHNGWLGGYRQGVGQTLINRLHADQFRHLDTMSDSLTLFLTVLRHLQDDPTVGLAGAVAGAVDEAGKVCAAQGREATMNVIAADAASTVITRQSIGHAQNSLHSAANGTAALPNARIVASEPFDRDGAWAPVPPSSMLTIANGEIAIEAL